MMTLSEQRRWLHEQRIWWALKFVRAAGSKPGEYVFRYSGDDYTKITVPEPSEER